MKQYISIFAVGLFAFVSAANADTATYLLTNTAIGGTSPFAQVILSQIGTGPVQVQVSLEPGVKWFVDTGNGSNHYTFAFNTDVQLAASDVTFVSSPGIDESGWSAKTQNLNLPGSPVSQSNGGAYNNGFYCYTPSCGKGGSAGFVGPLTFNITKTDFNIGDFRINASNGQANLFSADVQSTTGATGLVWGGTLTATAPEPGSYVALLTVGMVGLIVVRKRREIADGGHDN